MTQTKEERALVNKIWYQKNKEEINRKHRERYEKTKEARLAKCKKYSQDNKEKIAVRQKEYYLNHKEERQKYIDDNKEEVAKRKARYRLTPGGKKKEIISKWKNMGIKSDNYDTLYNNYLSETHCDFCRVKFGKWGDGTGTFKCCDHNHETGLFRNFLCQKCNLQRG